MTSEPIYIVAYDVKAKYTQKCAKVLENYGERLQQSVFMIHGERMLKDALEDINKLNLKELNLLVFEVKNILSDKYKPSKDKFIFM